MCKETVRKLEWSAVDTLSTDCDLQDPLQAMCRRCSGRALKESNSGPITFDRHCHAISVSHDMVQKLVVPLPFSRRQPNTTGK